MDTHVTQRTAELEQKRLLYDSMTDEERISGFVKQNRPDTERTADEWMEIHQALTGSCSMGGLRFIRDKGLKRYEKYTTVFFLNAVDGAYGSEIISKLKKYYSKEG